MFMCHLVTSFSDSWDTLITSLSSSNSADLYIICHSCCDTILVHSAISLGQVLLSFPRSLPTYHAPRHVQTEQASWSYYQTIDVSYRSGSYAPTRYIILCFTASFVTACSKLFTPVVCDITFLMSCLCHYDFHYRTVTCPRFTTVVDCSSDQWFKYIQFDTQTQDVFVVVGPTLVVVTVSSLVSTRIPMSCLCKLLKVNEAAGKIYVSFPLDPVMRSISSAKLQDFCATRLQ